MANTYTQLYIHIVFAVKERENVIKEKFRIELEKIICTIVKEYNSKPLAVFCNPDHTHILIGLDPNISISKLVEAIKSQSSGWINRNNLIVGKFNWQKGYGAFSYSKSQIDTVVKYILQQPEHHKKNSFRQEYMEFLNKFDVSFEERYLFEWYD